jgi:hypothetical protein
MSYFFSAPTLLEGVPPLDQFFDSCSRSPHNAFGICRFIPQHRQHGRTSKLKSFPHPAPTGNFSAHHLRRFACLMRQDPSALHGAFLKVWTSPSQTALELQSVLLELPHSCYNLLLQPCGFFDVIFQRHPEILQLVPRRGSIGSTLAIPKGTITTCKRHCFPQLVSYLAQRRLHLISRLATQFLCKI